jgi:hypothetical protein
MHTKPNPVLTPGGLCTPDDQDFKEYRYAEHISYCQRNVPFALQFSVLHRYNIPLADRNKYKIDHLIPLTCGGSNSLDNLWPQPIAEALEKERLEHVLYLQLRAGNITQAQVVKDIYNWFYR